MPKRPSPNLILREFVGGSLDGELIELPAGQFCFNLDDGADGHYEEYWLDAETGKMVLKVLPD